MEKINTRSKSTQAPQNADSQSSSVSKKTLKMRRYRLNVALDPERHELAKQRDRERKKTEREEKKKRLAKNPLKQAEEKSKKSQQNRAYYCKVKEKKKKMTKKKSEKSGKRSGGETLKKEKQMKQKHDSQQKKENVMKVQNWRLRVALRKGTQECTTTADCAEPSADPTLASSSSTQFGSRWTKYRAVKKARSCLPKSPRKRAEIVEKLAESPASRKRLEDKGFLMPKDLKRKLELGTSVVKSLKTHISEIKPKGNSNKWKFHAYKVLWQVITKKNLEGAFRVKRRKHARESSLDDGHKYWWIQPRRKLRKDRLPQAIRDVPSNKT